MRHSARVPVGTWQIQHRDHHPAYLTWDEFMANNEKIKAAGKAPVIQTFGTTWTSQLFVLGDYYNVQAQAPDFAEQPLFGRHRHHML